LARIGKKTGYASIHQVMSDLMKPGAKNAIDPKGPVGVSYYDSSVPQH
jgi:hypothetical protein